VRDSRAFFQEFKERIKSRFQQIDIWGGHISYRGDLTGRASLLLPSYCAGGKMTA
jgi:hypothetical protein